MPVIQRRRAVSFVAEGEFCDAPVIDRGGDSGDCGGDRGTGTAAGVVSRSRATGAGSKHRPAHRQSETGHRSGQPIVCGHSRRYPAVCRRAGTAQGGYQTVSPAELARQANAEPSYRVSAVAEPVRCLRSHWDPSYRPVSTVAEPARTLDPETIYVRARPGVVVVGGVYKCTKCKRWHVRCASGFVVRRDGLIVTNLHTVEAFKKLDAVRVMTEAGRVYPVLAVLAASRLNDLALLKVDAEDLPPLPVAKDVPVGAAADRPSHPILPGGKTNCFYTFSRGMVVGKFTLQTDKGQPLKVLAVSNDYGSGSSGGPILNDHGAVVAVACQALPLLQPDHEERADDLAVRPAFVQHPRDAQRNSAWLQASRLPGQGRPQ